MRYPWIFIAIACIWFALGLIMTKAPERANPTTLYVVGVVFTTIVALKGFKDDVHHS
jgi:hypothetical protein